MLRIITPIYPCSHKHATPSADASEFIPSVDRLGLQGVHCGNLFVWEFLTDAIRMLIGTEGVCAYAFKGKRYDAGDKADYIRAIIDFALEREDLRDAIENYLPVMR